jgi:hypothetical protein
LWPSQRCRLRVSWPSLASLFPHACRSMWGWIGNGIEAGIPSRWMSLLIKSRWWPKRTHTPPGDARAATDATPESRPLGWVSILGTTDMQSTLIQFDLMPLQAHHLTRSQAVWVGQEEHGCVPMAVPAGFAGMGPSVVPARPGAGIRVSRSGGGLLGSLPSPSPFPPLLPSPPFAGAEPYRLGGKVESPLLFRIACHRVTKVVIVASSDPCPMNV